MTNVQTRVWTVDDYYRMADTGILKPDERVELIQGQIIPMSPKQPPHSAMTQWAAVNLRDALADRALIRVQEPIRLSQLSEPEPDLAIVSPDPNDYSLRHPGPADILLIIEVSSSTLAYDPGPKSQLYAESQIPEYWILDIQNMQVLVFRDPEETYYRQIETVQLWQNLKMITFPEVSFLAEYLFPPSLRNPRS